ncbi:DUF6090 family protein [Robiginitalea sp. SC105]|uniref:DUF6090 family protein n=1 Tax=Robiginitalea sp. SC105 TaxID=2762332 RepID=UPI0016397441|nr:DUF6090 family protein [Robiginitalea sp. SC105]MBC2838605.1 hypothetical protein [Robiginitalea sp. SC105]
MLYAFGEILLVVIGILIALQIDNWNEQRKVDGEILKALTEIRSNLISDSLSIRDTRIKKLDDIHIQSTVIRALENRAIPYDSLEYHLGRVMIARRIVFLDNGYQLMKKFGLELLKNLKLRNELIYYYTNSTKNIIDDTEDDDYEFLTVFLPYARNHFLDWNYSEGGVPADYEQLKSDQYFLTCLKLNIKNAESTLAALQNGARKIQEILPMLDEAISAYE